MNAPASEHAADFEWAQAIAVGNAEARQRFTREYGEKILQTAYIWCKPFCNKDCHLRRAGIRRLMGSFLRQECDQVLEGYAFLLDQLENKILRRYRGEAALSSFLFSVLHPNGAYFQRYRIEFVRSEKGKYVQPVWAKDLSAVDCAVLKELTQGCDVEDAGFRLRMPLEEVQAAADRVRDAAVRAGSGKYWRYLSCQFHEIQMPVLGSDDDEEAVFDPPDPNSLEERLVLDGEKKRLAEALARLSPMERVILTLRLVEEKPVSEVARAVGKTDGQVRSVERRALAQLREVLAGDDASA